jgi:hypothetical protein
MSQRNKLRFGKIVKVHQGYDIRQMITTKAKEGKKIPTRVCPTGKFGVYAGKTLVEQYPSVDAALEKIKTILNK